MKQSIPESYQTTEVKQLPKMQPITVFLCLLVALPRQLEINQTGSFLPSEGRGREFESRRARH